MILALLLTLAGGVHVASGGDLSVTAPGGDVSALRLSFRAPRASSRGDDASLRNVVDFDGRRVDPFAGDPRAVVLVFIHPDCPISNRYAPELNRIYDEYKARIRMWLVYPGRDDSLESIRTHYREFALRAPALLDPDFTLADIAGAAMTPEAAVFVFQRVAPGFSRKERIYLGRIDDRAVRLGLVRAEPRTRDLAGVLARVVRGEHVEPSKTQAIGCYIKALP